jgi:hypothetical protein
MSAPPLRRSEKNRPGADPKWAIGDALLAAPAEQRDAVADEVGIDKADGRSYWRTAEAWPPHTRTTAASWSTYRELAPLGDRFAIIRPGMTMRDAALVRTGKPLDRRATHKLSDEQVIDDVVRLMLSPRRRSVVPLILQRLNSSKEGRKAARDRRSTSALRRLDDEIRLVQKEVRRRQGEKSPALRFMESRRRLLDTEVNVEEVALLFNDPDERGAVDDDDWRKLAERLVELRDRTDKVAHTIVAAVDTLEAEGWEEGDAWTTAEISDEGSDDIVDAVVVDED